MRHLLALAVATAALLSTPADAGLFKKHGKTNCDTCTPACEEACNPCDYKCKRTDKSEPIKKDCALIESEAICIPPITTRPFDCFRKKNRCSGCGLRNCKGSCDGCATVVPQTSDSSCDGGSCGSKNGGLFSCLGGCGKIRCVKKLGSDSYECGEKCVTTWEAVRIDCCGHELSDGESADEDFSADPVDVPEPEESDGDDSKETDDTPLPPLEPIEDKELEDAPGPPAETNEATKSSAAKRLYFGARKRS